MKCARGFSLFELVVVLAIIAAVTFMVTGRGESDAYERQVALNEAAKIRFFVSKGFAQARSSNEPIEVVATGHRLMLRGARSGTVYDTLDTKVYAASVSGVTTTLYPSGTVTGGDCTLALEGSYSTLRFAIQPGGLVREVLGDVDCPTTLTVAGTRPSLPTGTGGAPPTDPPPPPPPTELDPPPPPPTGSTTGSLQVNIENPGSAGTDPEGDLRLHNDTGLIRTIDRDTLVSGLDAGTYTLYAFPITLNGCAYEPTRDTFNIGILPNDTSFVTVTYQGADSRLNYVTLNGLSTSEAVVLEREGGTAVLRFKAVGAQTVTVSDTPTDFSADLPTTVNDPGDVEYELTFAYAPNLEPQQRTARIEVQLDGCGTSDNAVVDVVQDAGSAPLSIVVSGLPAGVTVPVHLESADARCKNLDFDTGNATLEEELPATCSYRVWGERLQHGGNYYEPQPVDFTLNAYEPKTVSLRYELNQGYVEVAVAGLPAGAPDVTVNVTGPVSESASVAPSGNHTFTLPPGTYSVEATPTEVVVGGVRYVLDNPTQSVALANGDRRSVTFAYRQIDGLVTISTSGLPSNEETQIRVQPQVGSAYIISLNGGDSKTLPFAPGQYLLTASDSGNYYVVGGGGVLNVASGGSYTVTFTFRRKTGILRIRVDHHKAWVDGVGTAYGDGDSAFEFRDFRVPTGTYTVKGNDTYVYITSAPQYRYRLISGNNKSATVTYNGTTTVTMDYIIERRNRYCVFVCWWGSWYKVGD
ncbi:hypothetical protein Ocepr_2361 (plasmid) [Oceanithermus profundus DSM 14977]|uniref:Prepilin-type N-terminal cleavage/methylation domain-containing protein n=1 Tax=Oceanithermus profundus (strain DSM 14977 / NBRC 100410 / VKM B-2274 / 506) TaxID=670487 RepID=E4UAN0_OCEP5|nr:prepilin-type N-terminal cleavage/methylation domain-containing protein [Oceanithermus profundus]ADR37809.1 hypothetical protein Ocepr_2361 [Oceanithermus profundus DSM 14977]